jgi:hypothetical protein
MELDTSGGDARGLSRREALRRGAIVGGAAVWAVPVVQSVGLTSALAQGTSPTGCGQRMTGGGVVYDSNGKKVAYGFQLRCGVLGPLSPGNNLTITDHTEVTQIFHLEILTSTSCTDNPGFSEGNPVAGFDTFTATGTGRYKAGGGGGGFTSGYTITLTLTDHGEPGTADTAQFTIKDPNGVVVIQVNQQAICQGNNQAHPGSNVAGCA